MYHWLFIWISSLAIPFTGFTALDEPPEPVDFSFDVILKHSFPSGDDGQQACPGDNPGVDIIVADGAEGDKVERHVEPGTAADPSLPDVVRLRPWPSVAPLARLSPEMLHQGFVDDFHGTFRYLGHSPDHAQIHAQELDRDHDMDNAPDLADVTALSHSLGHALAPDRDTVM